MLSLLATPASGASARAAMTTEKLSKAEQAAVKEFTQKIRDAAGELLLQVKAGEISAEQFQRELDTCKALSEMIGIAADMGPWSCPPEEHMRREGVLIEKWPEACRRAGVGAIPMPDDFLDSIVRRTGKLTT
jgi:hypothetical protein